MHILNIMGPVSRNAPEQTAQKLNSYFSGHKITVGVLENKNESFKRECDKRDIKTRFFGPSVIMSPGPLPPIPSKGYFRSLYDATRRSTQYDLIHVYGGPRFHAPIGAFYAFTNQAPLIIRFNGYVPLPDSRLKRIMSNNIVRKMIKKHKTVFNSNSQKEDIFDEYDISNAADANIIPPGILTERFNFVNNNRCIRKSLGIDEDTKIIGSVLTPRPVKRVDRAFKIVKTASREMDIAYVIVGDSQYVSEYKQLCAEMGISENVYWVGHKNQDELSKWYSLFDVTILTSEWESFGMSLSESYLCETPCVAFDVGGMSDQIRDGSTGWLIEPYDLDSFSSKIVDLLTDTKSIKTFGKRGREYVQNRFSLNTASKRYGSMIQDLN